MEEVTVKVEAGIQPFGRPIAESAEAHEGEEGRLKAEAAKGHDSDKTAGAQERAVDESEDDGDDDATPQPVPMHDQRRHRRPSSAGAHALQARKRVRR